MPFSPRRKTDTAGLGIDADGGPVIDPTQNVLDLVHAAINRQDDLREAHDRLNAEGINHQKELSELRAKHSRDLSVKESSRLDAIRQVDQLAVTRAAEQTLTAVNALASSQAREAETLRNSLTSTAAALATQNADTVKQISDRISSLERSSYEGKGKQAVADPMLAELVAEMKNLRESRANVTGKSQGISAAWAALLGVVVLITGLIGVATFVFTRPSTSATQQPPVYVLAPNGTMLPSPPPVGK
jgi:hypothetical protein